MVSFNGVIIKCHSCGASEQEGSNITVDSLMVATAELRCPKCGHYSKYIADGIEPQPTFRLVQKG